MIGLIAFAIAYYIILLGVFVEGGFTYKKTLIICFFPFAGVFYIIRAFIGIFRDYWETLK